MSVTWGNESLARIIALEAERRALWDKAARGRLRSDEIGRLRDLSATLARRWEDRRAETAGAKAGHLDQVVSSADEWQQDRTRGRALQVANI
jgi:hypothetical protein